MKSKKKSFKNITKNQDYLQYVKSEILKGFTITESVENLCRSFGLEYSDNLRRTFSAVLKKKGIIESKEDKNQPLEQSDEFKEAQNREVKKSKYYLLTWAQAETQVHKQFWENMKAYAEHIGAEIIVT